MIICLLMSGVYSNMVFAGWSNAQSQGPYANKFGDFPPLDIDQQLQDNLATEKKPEKSQSQVASLPRSQSNPSAGSATVDTSNFYQTNTNSQQGNSLQTLPQSNAQINGEAINTSTNNAGLPKKHHGKPKKKHKSGFGFPFDSKGSGFSAPWSNNGSGFSVPWNNRRSSFSGPWDNNRSGFSAPWDSKNSSFSFPWGDNDSGFGPWGDRRHR